MHHACVFSSLSNYQCLTRIWIHIFFEIFFSQSETLAVWCHTHSTMHEPWRWRNLANTTHSWSKLWIRDQTTWATSPRWRWQQTHSSSFAESFPVWAFLINECLRRPEMEGKSRFLTIYFSRFESYTRTQDRPAWPGNCRLIPVVFSVISDLIPVVFR